MKQAPRHNLLTIDLDPIELDRIHSEQADACHGYLITTDTDAWAPRIPRHCDCCAADLPAAYISALLYDQSVVVCSGRCLADLVHIWAPTVCTWVAWRLAGMVVAAMALLWWGR